MTRVLLQAMVFVSAALVLCMPAVAQAAGWSDVSVVGAGPGGTSDAPMCFDAARGYSVLVKGAETWAYSASGWTQIVTPSNPTVGAVGQVWAQDMVYDASGMRPVLATATRVYPGGPSINAGAIHLYFSYWDGVDWRPHSTMVDVGSFSVNGGDPPFPFAWSMCHDSMSGELLLHMSSLDWGGGGAMLTRTRTFNGSGWVTRAPLVSPPIPWTSKRSMFFDAVAGRAALVAESPPSYWHWNSSAGNWAQMFPSYIGAPITNGTFGKIAFNSVLGRGIGLGVDQPYTTRTLRYGGGNISLQTTIVAPSVRTGYSICFDAIRNVCVLHGGGGYADTWELALGQLASVATFGSGCAGTFGTPAVSTLGSVPVMSSTYTIQVSGMPWNSPAFMCLGWSNTSYGGAALPANLGFIGAPTCSLFVSIEALSLVPNILGVGIWQIQVPSIVGARFYNQAAVLDIQANALGLVLSNAVESTIGN